MRKIIAVLVTLALLATACQPRDGSKPNASGWNGTSYTKCQVPPTPPPGRDFRLIPGKVHILIIVLADSISGGCKPNLQRPLQIRINGTLNKQPAMKLDRGRPMPWSARVLTPHFEHLLVPVNSQTKGRIYEVSVHAVIEDLANTNIRCAIFFDGTRASQDSARISGTRISATASCIASGVV